MIGGRSLLFFIQTIHSPSRLKFEENKDGAPKKRLLFFPLRTHQRLEEAEVVAEALDDVAVQRLVHVLQGHLAGRAWGRWKTCVCMCHVCVCVCVYICVMCVYVCVFKCMCVAGPPRGSGLKWRVENVCG